MDPTRYPRADLDLSRRLERTEGLGAAAHIDSKRRLWPDKGSERLDVSGTIALFDGAGSPMTQTFYLGMNGPLTDADLDELEGFYTERGAETHHEVSPHADPTALAKLTERGYRPFEFSSMLYRPVAGGLDAPPPDLTVRETGEGDTETWAEVAIAGWSEYGDVRHYLEEAAAILFERPDAHGFLVEKDGTAIASGGLFICDDVAFLAGAATIPSARRQGAQLALLHERLRFARERGCTIAMMGAQPGSGSQRNAERNGFRIAYTRIKWRLPLDDD